MATTLLESVALRPVLDNVYETILNPERMGNNANIAYGGCTIAAAVNAAHFKLPPLFHLYSAMGSYLSPALTDRKLQCTVRELRRTRAFVTKQVEVSQLQNDGNSRACLIMLADFHVAEPTTLLAFSRPPAMQYTPAEETLDTAASRAVAVAVGQMSKATEKALSQSFDMLSRFLDQRPPLEGVISQNYGILAKTLPTTQDAGSPTGDKQDVGQLAEDEASA